MARTENIELPDGTTIPVLYEDRSVIAIDKPAGWMLIPYNWDKTDRNLHLAIDSSIRAGDYWARSRNLKYLRHVHRLDAATSGILLLARSPGALHTFGRLFESRRMKKQYLAVTQGIPREQSWCCRAKIAVDSKQIGRMKIDLRNGKETETRFRVIEVGDQTALIEAEPLTGRTHQIRLHLATSGLPVVGDSLYGKRVAATVNHPTVGSDTPLALRAVALAYFDPFRKKNVRIQAPVEQFCVGFGFAVPKGYSA